jgi:hypothetical protein
MKIENIKITKDQAESLKDLIDIWFFREVRENKDIDNTMWAWNILDIYKQCQEIIDGYNTKAQPSNPENNIAEISDDFIEELLEIHFMVKTKSGKNKILSWFNFKNPEDTFVELFGDDKENPKRKLSFSMKCDGYDSCITDV